MSGGIPCPRNIPLYRAAILPSRKGYTLYRATSEMETLSSPKSSFKSPASPTRRRSGFSEIKIGPPPHCWVSGKGADRRCSPGHTFYNYVSCQRNACFPLRQPTWALSSLAYARGGGASLRGGASLFDRLRYGYSNRTPWKTIGRSPA